MKLFFKQLFKFFACALILYIGFVVLFGLMAPGALKKNLTFPIGSYGHMFSRIKEVQTKKNIDLLFVGSSHSYRGFDPRIFEDHNYSCFNLGSSSQSPIQTEILFKRYLAQLNPKLVVFEVYPKTFESDGVEAGLDLLANDKIDLNVIKMCFQLNNIKTYNALIFGLFAQASGLNKNFHESRIVDEDTYIDGGYVEKKIQKFKSTTNIKKSRLVLSQQQLKPFVRMIDELKKNKIQYILVQAPVIKKLYNSFENRLSIDSIYSNLGSYYNFNNTMNLNDSLFYDTHHLNQNGVTLFNKEFLKVVLDDKKL